MANALIDRFGYCGGVCVYSEVMAESAFECCGFIMP